MRGLIAAIQFITILPAGKSRIYEPVGMIPYFPIVGLILGVVIAVVDRLGTHLWPPAVVALLDVVFLVFLTGAFHLDGLGDSADGLLGHHSRSRALEIMKDSRVGVMGVTAILLALAVKWGGILSLGPDRTLLLVIIPAYARSGMIFGIRFLNYGRPHGGTGHALFREPIRVSAFSGLLLPIALSAFAGWDGLRLNLFFVGITLAVLLYFKQRIGCITGDMLGAMTEITEALLFLLISAGPRP